MDRHSSAHPPRLVVRSGGGRRQDTEPDGFTGRLNGMDDFEATMARARAQAAALDGAVEALCGAARVEDVTRLLDALRADLDR